MTESNADLQVLFNQARCLGKPEQVQFAQGASSDNIPRILLIPNGYSAQTLKPLLDQYRDRSERIVEDVTLADQASLIAYIKRFQHPATSVFIDPRGEAGPVAVAVIDHHDASLQEEGLAGLANYRCHKARYAFSLSPELKRCLKPARSRCLKPASPNCWKSGSPISAIRQATGG